MSSRNRSRRYSRPAPSRSRRGGDVADPPEGAIVVGRVIRPHGLDGTLRIQSHSDNPARFQAGEPLDVAGQSWTVASCHDLPDGHALLRLEGLIDPNAARRLSGEWVLAAEDAAPELPPGEYYHYQLVGLAVVTEYGENLGHVREILETGSNDVYVVASDTGDEVLLPAIEQVVKRIDLASREIVVHLIDGLR